MNKKSRKINFKRGQIVLVNTLLFLAIAIVILFGLSAPIFTSRVGSKSFMQSKQAWLVGNSAAEEALYRLKNGFSLDSSESINLLTGSATILTTDTIDGKTVTVESESGIFNRNIQVNVIQGVGVSFNYGVQVGSGGFEIGGGSGINGSVYSNGDILGNGGAYITGSAIAANVSDPTPNQTSTGDFPPPFNIDFGGNTTPQDASQSFVVSTTVPVSSVRVYIKKSVGGAMNNITFRIVNDNNGSPGKTSIASANLSASKVTTSYNYITVPFTSNPTLTPGTTYWLVLDTGAAAGGNYSLGSASSVYVDGLAKTGSWSSGNGGTWNSTSPSGLDMYFDIYTGGDTSVISGVTVGTNGLGDAWAREVNTSTVQGTIYCQVSSGNNKECDISRSDPVEQPLPISDGNIEDWKEQAEEGGILTGNQSYSGVGVFELGPKKVVGNISVGSGAILEITGTLWVTGDITVTSGGIVRLSASYFENSDTIVSDGKISITGGGQFQGSGTEGSYILVVTTSTCPTNCSGSPAITISGGSGSVILNAQKGTISFSGGAQAKQATGHKIVMSGSSTLEYESGLANQDFSGGGPSGTWNISSWEEI